MIAGCYHLQLYCDGVGCEAGEYGERAQIEVVHERGSTTRAIARRRGWRLDLRNGVAVCPSCIERDAEVAP